MTRFPRDITHIALDTRGVILCFNGKPKWNEEMETYHFGGEASQILGLATLGLKPDIESSKASLCEVNRFDLFKEEAKNADALLTECLSALRDSNDWKLERLIDEIEEFLGIGAKEGGEDE